MIFERQAMIPIRQAIGSSRLRTAMPPSRLLVAGIADGNLIPDVIGRYNFSGDYGNVSVAAIARQLAGIGRNRRRDLWLWPGVSGKLNAARAAISALR